MMRIALVLPDLRFGGAERVAINLANSFISRGHSVDVVLMVATGEFLHDLKSEIRVVDLKVGRIRSALLPLIRYFRQVRPDAVLAFMWPITIISLWARVFARVNTRVVVSEHTTWSRSELGSKFFIKWQIRATMHLFFPKADAIVAVSQGAASDMASFAGIDIRTITYIYNPVVGVEKLFSAELSEPAEWWSGKHYKVLAVGALKDIKDYGTLLTAFAQLRKRHDARLLILGEGECRLKLAAQVRSLGLESSVFMPGFRKDVSPYYHQADLHVLSSTGEGLGNVIIEALEAGTPVVSTDCPSGPREILQNGTFGRLVPVGDASALALAMEASLLGTHDRKALKARAQDFSIEKAADQYEKLLIPSVSEGRQ